MKLLVLGANGMIGNAMFRVLSQCQDWEVWGAMRSQEAKSFFPEKYTPKLLHSTDFLETDALIQLLSFTKFDVVINCAGLTKHRPTGNDPYMAIAINAFLPHRLSRLCRVAEIRLIHISTDCVFSGNSGGYIESSLSDAVDIYGKSKYLGEIHSKNCITLRTSTIGHELQTRYGLLEWFLSQKSCKGYENAIFSGLPSVVFAQIVRDVVIPRPQLSGLYHIGSNSINKLELLRLIAHIYNKHIEIIPDDSININRSLNTNKFQNATGYLAPEWPELLEIMHSNYIDNGF